MSIIAGRVLILFVLIFIGFFAEKKKIIREESNLDFTNLVLKITLPVTVFCSMIRPWNPQMLKGGIQIVAMIFLLHMVTLIIGVVLVRVLHIPLQEKSAWLFSIMFMNNGFMGFPLALALYGNDGLFLMAFANMTSNVLMFTIGIMLMTWYQDRRSENRWREVLFNPVNVAVLFGLIFYFLQIPIPDIVMELLQYLSNITSGMSMLILGFSLSRMAVREFFTNPKMFLLALVRLLLIPMLTFLCIRPMKDLTGNLVANIMLLNAALPAASAQSMFCEQYGLVAAPSGQAVMISTILCLFSLPCILSFFAFS